MFVVFVVVEGGGGFEYFVVFGLVDVFWNGCVDLVDVVWVVECVWELDDFDLIYFFEEVCVVEIVGYFCGVDCVVCFVCLFCLMVK